MCVRERESVCERESERERCRVCAEQAKRGTVLITVVLGH